MLRITVLVWLLAVETSRSAPTDEIRSLINEGEISMNDDGSLMGIIPGGISNERSQNTNQLSGDFVKYSKIFSKYMSKGTTEKGLTFNIYNDDMKEAAKSLFELIYSTEVVGYNAEKFNYDDINDDLVTYVLHHCMLYRDKRLGKTTFVPPFITKPNFFVNGETIIKALKIINDNPNNTDEARVNQYYKTEDTIIINTNYSGWNLPQNGGEEELNYFREDISLNSYYYGVHLMHPYWMFGHTLYSRHPKQDEHYYFTHQQLAARLFLEQEHLKQGNNTAKKSNYGNFNPYLIHENGLPFPSRSNTLGEWSEDRAKIKAIDIAIKECMSRGRLTMQNMEPITLTEDNYVNLLTKLIRANYEVGKVAKIVRSLFGYGYNGYPYDEYNPAPSLLHHPQTSLRDPIYWSMIQYVLTYFIEYTEYIEALNVRDFVTKVYHIIDADIPKITTYFDYYQFNINRAISKKEKMSITVNARQKRLKHSTFEINFTVDCIAATKGIVRLFIGPSCSNNCWDMYSKFYELDKFAYSFKDGLNTVTWSPETSTRFSNDDYYNLEGSSSQNNKTNNYHMFKFPKSLLIPRGLEKGLNLTLFIMITSPDEMEEDFIPDNNLYEDIYHEVDRKPLGFPFNRPVTGYDDDAANYKFYDITIYHKKNNIAKNGYFSPHLD